MLNLLMGRLMGTGLMPKKTKELSAIAVSHIKAPGLHSVGGVSGLKLQVKAADIRSWILRVTVLKKIRDIGLGSYPTISLKNARDAARAMLVQTALGNDPVALRKKAADDEAAARANLRTFDQCAAEYILRIEKQWSNTKTRAQWESSLKQYASPIIGKMPVSNITTQDILQILTPIWTTKTETASRVRTRVERVLAYATTHEYRTGDNPARLNGHLDTILPPAQKLKRLEHQPALPHRDASRFLTQLRLVPTTGAKALEFTILTAARSGDTRGATWSEINLNNKTWTIPASRMKAGKEHVVPLSSGCMSILSALTAGNDSDLVFKGTSGILSDMTLGKVIKSLHAKDPKKGNGFLDPVSNRIATVHGFRSTFRDWAAELTSFPREVIEHCLAHRLKDKAEAAYQRSTTLNKRTKLMQKWCDYLNK
jgi:integrase